MIPTPDCPTGDPFCGSCEDQGQAEREVIASYLASPDAEKALASRLFATYGDETLAPIRHDWEADARAILAAWKEGL